VCAALDLTQQQLEQKLGTYRETVALWKTGAARPHRLYEAELKKLKAKLKK